MGMGGPEGTGMVILSDGEQASRIAIPSYSKEETYILV